MNKTNRLRTGHPSAYTVPCETDQMNPVGQDKISTEAEELGRPIRIDQKKIRMLLIDDNEQDVAKLRNLIDNIDFWQIEFDWAATLESAMKNIQHTEYDFCMLDSQMARNKGRDVLGMISNNGNTIPHILLKNKTDHLSNIDTAITDSEFTDCIEKTNLTPELLKHCIRYTIERSRRIKKLEEAKKRLQELSSKLINAQERERKIIGRELHDSIGSSLTAIRMALAAGNTDAGKPGTEKNSGASGEVPQEAILSMIDETIEETRRISEKLRPSILDDLGLIKTIGWMCRKFSLLHPQINIKTDVSVRESDVPDPLRIVIYRILQEAFNNIAKHSHADTVELGLRRLNGDLELIVHDNGSGFNPENIPSPGQTSGGYGLEGMQDRVKFTQGSFKIISKKGNGTTLRILWPILPEAGF